jgi:hypothetical protein
VLHHHPVHERADRADDEAGLAARTELCFDRPGTEPVAARPGRVAAVAATTSRLEGPGEQTEVEPGDRQGALRVPYQLTHDTRVVTMLQLSRIGAAVAASTTAPGPPYNRDRAGRHLCIRTASMAQRYGLPANAPG